MTKEALKYCMRGIVQCLDGNMDKFHYYVNKAMKLNNYISCTCGDFTINCKYGKKPARLCTNCGRVWRDGNVVRKCLTGRKTA